ncbi:branched-chain-amino-acid aminotransferase 2 [Clostridia bacterium]|nr:branched-chain-amino-acid aminotransferase 2 [Clostridia bacterium]
MEEIKIIRTANPKQKPPENDLPFGKYFTDHMFVLEYDEGEGWHSPVIKPYEPLQIDPATMVLHYGQAVFEGLKAYPTKDGRTLLFRPRRNFERLNASDERLCIPALDVDFAIHALKELIKVDIDWIPKAPNTTLYIRPFVIATEIAIGVHPSHSYKFIIILSPVGPYYPEGLDPVRICVEDEYVRTVKGGIGFTKASANYAISLKGQEKAKELGFTQVLWLDGVERRYVEEVGTMNIFFKIAGEVITPELSSGSILAGVTRDSVIQMLKHWGVPVHERKIDIQEIIDAAKNGALEESFGSGTAAVVSPIGEFFTEGESLKVGNGETGELAKRLYGELTGLQYGDKEDVFGWVVDVNEETR